MRKINREWLIYRLISGFERMRSNDVALDAMESESERVVLDPSDFVSYGLRCLHFCCSSIFLRVSFFFWQRLCEQENNEVEGERLGRKVILWKSENVVVLCVNGLVGPILGPKSGWLLNLEELRLEAQLISNGLWLLWASLDWLWIEFWTSYQWSRSS